MKDKFDRIMQRIKDNAVPLAIGTVVGSAATITVIRKSNLSMFDPKHVIWWTSVSPDLIAEALEKNGQAIFDCAECDRTLTLINQLYDK